MRARVGFVLAALAASVPVTLGGQTSAPAPASRSQDAPPTFRSGVEFVRFDAFVTDKHGEPVAGLTADDFEVYEDGTLQTIQQFSPVLIPPPRDRTLQAVSRPMRPPPDVTANDESQDRIYVIVFDGLSWQESVRATQIVRRFLDNYFGDSDLAALVTFDRPGSMHFTNDRAALMKVADSFVARFANAWDVRPLRRSRIDSLERATIFGDIARALGHIEARRKSIIFISGGLGFDPYDAVDMPQSTFSEEARAAMEPIMAGNLTVYPISPEFAGPMEMRTMRALAYVTGGTPAGTDINKALRQIVRDNSTYYVLGYESTNPRRDGGFRRIKVRTRRPDLKVRARDGYFVEFPKAPDPNQWFSFDGRRPVPRPPFTPRSDFTPEMTRAMASPVVLTDVPMTVFATPRKSGSRDGTVTVVVEIPSSGLDLTMSGTAATGQIDLVVGAASGRPTLRSNGFTYDVNVRGEALDRMLRNGLRLTADVTLEPGEYRLHVAAGGRGGRTGKVFYDLTVPDFTRPLLALSGVSLTSTAANDLVTLQGTAPPATELPGPVTASRSFRRAETLTVYAEIYENVWWTDSDHLISLATELRAENGETIPMTSEARSSKAPRPAGGGHGFMASLPLAAVPPGSYVLRIEAQSAFDGARTVTREVPIRVY